MRLFVCREGRGFASAKIVFKLADNWRCQMRKPVRAKVRIDVQMQVLSISVASGALYVIARLKPLLASLTDSRRLTRRNVDTLADIDGDFGFTRVGVLLALEG